MPPVWKFPLYLLAAVGGALRAIPTAVAGWLKPLIYGKGS